MSKNTVQLKRLRVAMITSLLPEGHYSQILAHSLVKHTQIDLTICTDMQSENTAVKGCGKIKRVWRRGLPYFFDVAKYILEDVPDIVHIQHEFNMYGGITSSVLFPFMIAILRLFGFPVIVTLHAVVAQQQVDETFMHYFYLKKNVYIRPLTIRWFFSFFYCLTGIFSTKIIVHTEFMRKVMTSNYHVADSKITVIRPVVPTKKILPPAYTRTFLYFGYLVRRHGLLEVIGGFARFLKTVSETYTFVLAGGMIPGQEETVKEISAFVRQHDLQNSVHIYGIVKTEVELASLFARALAVVIPAKLSIAASGPLYHARGYGAAVVASSIDNLSEELKEGKDGLEVHDDRWDKAFARIASEPDLAPSLRRKSRGAAEKYDPSLIAHKYEILYNQFVIGT